MRKNYSYSFIETPDESILKTSVGLASHVTIVNLNTHSTGSLFVTFPDIVCEALDVINTNMNMIEYIRNSSGSAFPIGIGSSRTIVGIKNANEISIRRSDQSNTPLTLNAEAIKY